MPSLEELRKRLQGFDYALENVFKADDSLTCEVLGKQLGPIRAVLRADDTYCNVGVMLGMIDAAPPEARYNLLTSFLEINFQHPFARISLFRVSGKDESEPSAAGLLVAETSFFWADMNDERWNARMKALHAASKAASLLLAARDALSSTNPFYSEVKNAHSPVERV